MSRFEYDSSVILELVPRAVESVGREYEAELQSIEERFKGRGKLWRAFFGYQDSKESAERQCVFRTSRLLTLQKLVGGCSKVSLDEYDAALMRFSFAPKAY